MIQSRIWTRPMQSPFNESSLRMAQQWSTNVKTISVRITPDHHPTQHIKHKTEQPFVCADGATTVKRKSCAIINDEKRTISSDASDERRRTRMRTTAPPQMERMRDGTNWRMMKILPELLGCSWEQTWTMEIRSIDGDRYHCHHHSVVACTQPGWGLPSARQSCHPCETAVRVPSTTSDTTAEDSVGPKIESMASWE